MEVLRLAQQESTEDRLHYEPQLTARTIHQEERIWK
jgi:hypothetical protein